MNLSSEKLVSKFAFKFKLYRYIKAKRLAPIQKALEGTGHPGNEIPKSYKAAALGESGGLVVGTNAGVAVNVRAVLDTTAEDHLNLHYIVVDKEGTLAALSVYGLEVGGGFPFSPFYTLSIFYLHILLPPPPPPPLLTVCP